MNRINTLVGAALCAGSFVGGSALAADQTTNQTSTNKADKTQVVPAREDLKPGAAPTVERMDDNAQRQHDRDRDGGAAGAKTGTGTGADAAAGAGTAAGTGTGAGAAPAVGAEAGQISTDKADKTQVMPAREDLKPGAAPTVENMDANAQRQHDRDRDGGAGAGAGTGAGAGAGTGAGTGAGADAAAGTGAGAAAGAGAGAGAGGSNTAADSSASGGSTAAAGGGETRDWAAVDTNSDNLISPEEMEEALKATGPQAGQKR